MDRCVRVRAKKLQPTGSTRQVALLACLFPLYPTSKLHLLCHGSADGDVWVHRPSAPIAKDTAAYVSHSQRRVVLYVANCRPAVGLAHDDIGATFDAFGQVVGISTTVNCGACLIVWFREQADPRAAMAALHGRP